LSPGATMRACLLAVPGELRLCTLPVPSVGPRELLVRVLTTGVCGSDLATYRGTHPYKRAPAVLGHELCGVVERLGSEVRGLAPGDLVCATAYSPCDVCAACSEGAPHLCSAKRSLSQAGFDGSFAEYVAVAENMAFKLRSDLDPVLGALVEPLSIAAHALKLARRAPGASLAIVGTGSIGLCTVVAARALRFGAVVCLDRDPEKGELALAHGATGYADVRAPGALVRAQKLLGGHADVVAVCSGHPEALDDAAALARPGGQIIVVSYFTERVAVDLNTIVGRELAVVGSALATPGDVAEVIDWLEVDGLDPSNIVRRRFALKDAALAMEAVERGSPGKTLIDLTGATS